jgi:hypothetical protein
MESFETAILESRLVWVPSAAAHWNSVYEMLLQD